MFTWVEPNVWNHYFFWIQAFFSVMSLKTWLYFSFVAIRAVWFVNCPSLLAPSSLWHRLQTSEDATHCWKIVKYKLSPKVDISNYEVDSLSNEQIHWFHFVCEECKWSCITLNIMKYMKSSLLCIKVILWSCEDAVAQGCSFLTLLFSHQ